MMSRRVQKHHREHDKLILAMTRRQKKNWKRSCREEHRECIRIIGSHLRWIKKVLPKSIPLRKTYVGGYDVFESRRLPYKDKDGRVVDCVVVKNPPNVGFFTPKPYMVLSPRAYSEMVDRVKERTNA